MRLRVFAGEVRAPHRTARFRDSLRGFLLGVFFMCSILLAASASAGSGEKRNLDKENHEPALRAILSGFVGRWHVDVFEKRDLAPPTEWKRSDGFEWRVELPEPGLMRFFSADSSDPFTEFALRDGTLVETTYSKGNKQAPARSEILLAEVEDGRNWTLLIEYPPSGQDRSYSRLEAVRMGDVLSWKESSADAEAGPYRVDYYGVSHSVAPVRR
jgi:hypothetical protein